MTKLICFLLFSISIFSQIDNSFKINKELIVNSISFEKSTGAIYRADKFHILTQVTLSFRNDSCYVTTKHTDDIEKVLSDEEYLRTNFSNNYDFVISKLSFFDIVNQLESIDFDAIDKNNFNVFDGCLFKINFGNANCEFNYSYHALDYDKTNDRLKLMKLFDEVWKLVK
jgi:hypothetical protein